MFTFKKIPVPTGETKEITAYESWVVRWTSRYSDYSSGTKEECEVFTSQEDALTFANSLKNAFKLLRHTSGTEVSVKQNK